MRVNGRDYRTIWIDEDDRLKVIDQRALPHRFVTLVLEDFEAVRRAIADMTVRGAGLIGATAAFGMWRAALEAPRDSDGAFETYLQEAGSSLRATRPTASNLSWAVERQMAAIAKVTGIEAKIATARETAVATADEDAECGRRIGAHGARLIQAIAARKGKGPVNILTHCNAGWLAFVDYGSALAPIYAAVEAGIDVHVWVDETRPRNQGASLTAWELGAHGIPHSLIVDNAGGHLMQHGLVDAVFVGADRVTRRGDVANKIGTYLKACAAMDNGVPFYVALPSSTFDLSMSDGLADIPIEERAEDEVRYVSGVVDGASSSGPSFDKAQIVSVRICPEATRARNWGFDVTPARLVTGLVTERGVAAPSEEGIKCLFPELFS
ncbi:MAG: S-methyl-5-thioribose-1-phosphate isomerase [Treponema sp.]|nr:S-methyl-5-thioribose-1-phosphate isomerase [Treponema sp.]